MQHSEEEASLQILAWIRLKQHERKREKKVVSARRREGEPLQEDGAGGI